ncbi:MAG: hypothetical protein QW804_01185 [Candidatus Bathyarchaeia archaeon]|nr:hypothetical protein [Candidatus Bathyarchaeota archaeon]
MRALLINLCLDPLSELEFVKPIEYILRYHGINTFIKRYMEISPEDLGLAEKVILCGSALKDDHFLTDKWFRWLEKYDRPILGVGSGSHAIAKAFGCSLINKTKIGMFKVRLIRESRLMDKRVFYAYFLTKRAIIPTKPLESLAKVGNLDCMIKHESREIYGCLFHPEVMNPEIIVNFISKT